MKKHGSLILLTLLIMAIPMPYARAESDSDEGSSTLGRKMTFSGESHELKRTQVLLSLDTPIEPGKNAVWCASFLSGWKALQNDLAGEPVELQGAEAYCEPLNTAIDPGDDLPQASYANVGWVQEGIIEIIRRDIKEMFPAKEPPSFPGILANSFLAYAYLEANVTFTLPYFQNRKPLVFADSKGSKTEVNSFGIRQEDEYAYFALRRQPKILYASRDDDYRLQEFAVDLCLDSQPSQIVVARISPELTLSATLSKLEKRIAETAAWADSLKRKHPHLTPYELRFGPNDVLLVPDVFWRISHHFTELEGRAFGNAKLEGQRIDVAMQEIVFRLDRSGAELKSEAKTYMSPFPSYFVLDQPFLIYMKRRGGDSPYFVVWVDNAELLKPFNFSR
jgi:hypothetical protein